MNNLVSRLASFHKNEDSLGGHPSLLASNGLYLDSADKKLKCAGCAYTADFSADMACKEVIRRHRTEHPECRMLKTTDSPTSHNNACANEHSNGFIVPTDDKTSYTQTTLASVLELRETEPSATNPSHRGEGYRMHLIDRTNPDLSLLRDQSFRRGTFRDWPTTAKADPDELSRSGFFFTGENDTVECAFCHGKLRKWESWDVPMQEHRKYFPSCSFLKSQSPTTRNTNSHFNIPQNFEATTGLHQIDPREVRARMDLPEVRYLLSNGFSKNIVQAAIENRLTTTGDDFPSIGDLLRCVEELQGGAMSSQSAQSEQSGTQRGEPAAMKQNITLPNGPRSSAASSPIQQKQMQLNANSESSESEKQPELQDLRERASCKICMDAVSNVLFLPCRHLVTCNKCAVRVALCPICRQPIREIMRVYQ